MDPRLLYKGRKAKMRRKRQSRGVKNSLEWPFSHGNIVVTLYKDIVLLQNRLPKL